MARFRFRLQSLLNVKTQVEDNLKNELANTIREFERQRTALSGLEEERAGCMDRLGSMTGRRITVNKVKEYNAYISLLAGRIVSQKENVKKAQDNVDKVRGELIEIVKEREMLEKLKEKGQDAFYKQQLKDEQMLIDEIVSYKRNDKTAGDKNG